MISCLCITQPTRLALLADAIGDFARQSFADRELVVVHDGGDACGAAVHALAEPYGACPIRVVAVAPGLRLGGLRNAAVAAARGDWVCQWDDDDRAHPLRLALQWDAAQAEGAAVNYLVDQLHWFRAEGRLFWDDWDGEPYPMNLVQGTLLARKAVLSPYSDVARGEDTLQTHALLWAAARGELKLSRLRGAGWCSVYVCHGGNAWDAAHHRAISATKHLSAARLLPLLPVLRARLAEYAPPLHGVRMSVGSQTVTLGDG